MGDVWLLGVGHRGWADSVSRAYHVMVFSKDCLRLQADWPHGDAPQFCAAMQRHVFILVAYLPTLESLTWYSEAEELELGI